METVTVPEPGTAAVPDLVADLETGPRMDTDVLVEATDRPLMEEGMEDCLVVEATVVGTEGTGDVGMTVGQMASMPMYPRTTHRMPTIHRLRWTLLWNASGWSWNG